MSDHVDRVVEQMKSTMDSQISKHLKRFTIDSIVSEEQKRALKKAGFICWEMRMWCLTDAGRAEAERLGYL